MTGGIKRVRDVIALCPKRRMVRAQSDDVRDVLTSLDLAEAAVTQAHAALATERERREAAEAAVVTLREEVEQLRASRATLILLVDRLAADRRQVYARLRDVMPWVGQCPFNPSQAREMFLLRDLASDTLREVSLDLDRAGIVSTSVVVETTGDDDGKDDQ